MIYLDTHVLVWLYSGETERLSDLSKNLINENDILISPIVFLELQYLYEIKRITKKPKEIIEYLSNRIGLDICNKNFMSIVINASNFKWTRDPFDRIIVSNASLDGVILVTKDQTILDNYKHSKW